MGSDIKVKLRGHFFEAGGYAKVNRNLALALKEKGIIVSIEPTTQAVVDLDVNELNEIGRNRGCDNVAIARLRTCGDVLIAKRIVSGPLFDQLLTL